MTDENEPYKELYAQFGLAYYHSECLYREICNFYAFSGTKGNPPMALRIEELLKQSETLTFGQLLEITKEYLPIKILEELIDANDKRNYLAHHFWFDNSHLMLSTTGLAEMISELRAISKKLDEVDGNLHRLNLAKARSFGVTDEILNSCEEEIFNGKPPDPLHNQRRIRKSERIIAAYIVPTEKGTTLIFETDDNVFWQLSEVGLGWTNQADKNEQWIIEKRIKQYLPSTIDPRPKIKAPWNYEIQLKRDKILWVKPGKLFNSFSWGIKI